MRKPGSAKLYGDAAVNAENNAFTANASHAANASCTSGCTRNQENDNATAEIHAAGDAANDAMPEQGKADDTLAILVATLLDLPAKDRMKLAASLANDTNPAVASFAVGHRQLARQPLVWLRLSAEPFRIVVALAALAHTLNAATMTRAETTDRLQQKARFANTGLGGGLSRRAIGRLVRTSGLQRGKRGMTFRAVCRDLQTAYGNIGR